MKFIDYYKVLGVSENADAAEIKKAFRRLARKYHPDVSKETGAEEKFKSVNEAYEVLKDSERRAEYDQLRKYGGGMGGQDFRPPPGWQSRAGHGSHGDFDGFSDFFESLFGGGHGFRESRGHGAGFAGGFGGHPGFNDTAPQASTYDIEVSLEESWHGAQRRISLSDPATGSVRSLDVKIPKGVQDGQKIRLKGQGGQGPGGRAVDLLLKVNLQPHRHYRVEGKNVTLKLPITPWEAALGTKASVPTLGGTVAVNIPAGSKGGRKMRLKGKGLPGSPPGDQVVELVLTMPENLSPEALKLMEKMRDEVQFNPRAELGV